MGKAALYAVLPLADRRAKNIFFRKGFTFALLCASIVENHKIICIKVRKRGIKR